MLFMLVGVFDAVGFVFDVVFAWLTLIIVDGGYCYGELRGGADSLCGCALG